jgi:NAD(P)H-dependent flavin oxidoreductase YrpB (nitropropane dioxygenase family)
VATGRQLAAALALGAAGVNCGTRFAVTAESNWPQSFKERAVAAEETATVLMFRPLRNTARTFHTTFTPTPTPTPTPAPTPTPTPS